MSAAVEFQNVDILFARQPGRAGRAGAARRACRRSTAARTRADIQSKFGVIVGVAGATLSVAQGEISVLMGLSGSGKSTLLRAANGLEPRDPRPRADSRRRIERGRRHLRHGAAAARAPRARRHGVPAVRAACPGARCARTSASGSSCAARRRRRARAVVDEKLELVGLSQWADRHVSELSGGMQQRVGLARAFATDADILLMDEPFSALDPLIRGKLQGELLALQERVKKTILFVSHDLDEALRLGDRISILQNGRIIQTRHRGGHRARAGGRLCRRVRAPHEPARRAHRRHDHVRARRDGLPRAARSGSTMRRRYRLSLSSGGEALALHLDGVEQALRHVRDDAGARGGRVRACGGARLLLAAVHHPVAPGHRTSGAARRGRQDRRGVRRGRNHPRARPQPPLANPGTAHRAATSGTGRYRPPIASCRYPF